MIHAVLRFVVPSLLGLAAAVSAPAQELRIGLAAEPTSADPHYHNVVPNIGLSRHIFESLVSFDSQEKPGPGLAESWRIVDDKTWEFKLRRGVKWHDGSNFSADDVVFTFSRAKNVPRSPGPFTVFIGAKVFEKVDDSTVLVRTPVPEPLMLNQIANIAIVSAKHGKNAETDDYNSGRAAIGTGPYRFAAFIPGERTELVRNDSYWGQKPDWAKVVLKPIKSDPSRVAALLAGDVDVIENIPTSDIPRVKADVRFGYSSTLSNRMIFLHLDRHRDVTPFVTAKDGGKIKNPLNDLKVRQAMSSAINRSAIVERIMDNEALPAGQFMPETYPGTSPKLKPDAFNLDRARKLLLEAGYPAGFKMTIHGTNGRYPNDTKVMEALAQMLTRAGIETSIDALPPANFFSRASTGGPGGEPEFSVMFYGGGAQTGEPSSIMSGVVATFDKSRGTGAVNRGRYSNPRVDTLLMGALASLRDSARAAALAEAAELAIADLAVIPLYFPKNAWAARKPLSVEPRSDETTVAMSVRPSQ